MYSNNQRGRIEIINSVLASKEYVKTKKIVEIIQNELDISFSPRTIQKDIELMKRTWPYGYNAPIEWDKKKKAYYYSDRNFTIQAFGLKEEDVKALLFYAKTLEQFKGIKIFESILIAIEKVIDRLNTIDKMKDSFSNRNILLTERIPICKGIEFIEPIITAIIKNQKITFDYTKFGEETAQMRTLDPILLKEDKNFWYVLGILNEKKSLTTFALDRISNLIVTNRSYKPKSFDADNYFKHSFGITVSEKKPIRIILAFSRFQGNYIKSVPIHSTQKIITDNKSELRISVIVKPSYEFYSKILSYGGDVKVISPKTIVSEVKRHIQAAFQLYN